jgi:uncharacterized protein (DUF2336 family)
VTAVHEEELEKLLQLARDKKAASRRALTACVADLFLTGEHVLSDHERFLMTDIMRQLVKEVEVTIRRALAERLAEMPGASRELILLLANDTIEVAYPILRRSDVLQDEELIEIIKHRTLEHQLAIASRRRLSGIVSEALVDAGNVDVIRTLLENPDAEIKATTIAYLVEQSKRVDTFQNPLLRRRELSPALAQRMYWWVSAVLRQHIVERFDIDPTRLDTAIEETVVAAIPPAAALEPPPARLAGELDRTDAITPRLLIETLEQGEVALFRALFARLSGLRDALINRLMFEPGGEGMAIACKAIGLTRADFLALFAMTSRARSPVCGEPHRVAAFFDRLDDGAAEVILKGWRRHPAYQRAIWEVDMVSRAPAGS